MRNKNFKNEALPVEFDYLESFDTLLIRTFPPNVG